MTAAFEFEDPGEGIHEAEILEVLVSAGDQVEEGQNLVVVETDKTSFELASPRSGTVADVVVSKGDRVQVGDTLLHYRDSEGTSEGEGATASDEQQTEASDEQQNQAAEGQKAEARDERRAGAAEKQPRQRGANGHGEARPRSGSNREGASRGRSEGPVRATPATRKLARELEVDLREVDPSGDHDRVLKEDVQAHAEAPDSQRREPSTEEAPRGRRKDEPAEPSRSRAPAAERDFERWGPVERVPLRSIRRRTAERMAESWRTIARVTHQDQADVTELERLRRRLAPRLEEEGVKLSMTVMIVKAVAALLRDYPRFNASLTDDKDALVLKHYVHIGVAVDTEAGLLVPVVRDVPSKSLRVLARELEQLGDAARAGKLRREQVAGGTFTVTNVGPIGGTGFTPLVNPPQTAILGLGRAQLQPVVSGDLDEHETRVRLMLPLSLSYDHRVIDGAEGARFARDLGALVADPDRFIAGI